MPEFTYTTTEIDQGKALDEAVAYGLKQGWEMISVVWEKQDEEQKHIFKILYNANVSLST